MTNDQPNTFLEEIQRLSTHRRVVFIITSVLLLILTCVGLSYSIRTFSNVLRGHDGHTNWFGHSGRTVHICFFSLIFLIYLMKRLLLQSFGKWIAAWFYFWFIAVSLPYIWFLISTSWRYQWAEPELSWFGDPILIWFLPTTSFVIDLNRKTIITLKWYVLRTLAEFLIFPIWMYCWIFFEFLGLGWIGP